MPSAEDVTSAESLATFRRLLKTHLFRKSFPDYMLDINWLSPVDLAVVLQLLRPPTNLLIYWLIDWTVATADSAGWMMRVLWCGMSFSRCRIFYVCGITRVTGCSLIDWSMTRIGLGSQTCSVTESRRTSTPCMKRLLPVIRSSTQTSWRSVTLDLTLKSQTTTR